MTDLITLPAIGCESLLISFTVQGAFVAFAWLPDAAPLALRRSELEHKNYAALFTNTVLDMAKVGRLIDSLTAKEAALFSESSRLEKLHGVCNAHPDYLAADMKAAALSDALTRAQDWALACRPITLTDCAAQMRIALSRDDLMLRDSEFNALERLAGIMGKLATYDNAAAV